jgi:hypothetical protein
MSYSAIGAEPAGTAVPASSVEFWQAIHRLRLNAQGIESWNLDQLEKDARLYLDMVAHTPPSPGQTPADAAESAKLTAYAQHILREADRARAEGRSLSGPPKWLAFLAVLAAIPVAWLVIRKGSGEWRHTTTVRRELG